MIDSDAPLRTDAGILENKYCSDRDDHNEDNHILDPVNPSPFARAGFACVSRFPLEPMHTYTQGVFSRRIVGIVLSGMRVNWTGRNLNLSMVVCYSTGYAIPKNSKGACDP